MLHARSWGRNAHGVASPSSPASVPSTVKRPSAAPALSTFILRDLALAETYGVAVDARGDVLQWGAGYGGQGVERTLTGKDLVRAVPTSEGKVFGLTKKGEVWVFASDKASQRPAGQPIDVANEARDGGWKWVLGKGTLWGRSGRSDVEALKLTTDVKLDKGEKCVPSSAVRLEALRADPVLLPQVHLALGRRLSPPRPHLSRPLLRPPPLPVGQHVRPARRPLGHPPRAAAPGQLTGRRPHGPPRAERAPQRDRLEQGAAGAPA